MIRPTRLGYYLIGLNVVLFLLAIGYSNNLLFLFTLILVAQSLFWLAATISFNHGSIKNLKVSNCFAKETNALSFHVESSRFQAVRLLIDDKKYHILGFNLEGQRVITSVQLHSRGKYSLRAISFYDSRPFGLFAKRIMLSCNQHFYVYPELQRNVSFTSIENSPVESGLADSHIKGEEDFLGLSPYSGEDFKKISWKHLARTDEVYTKQGLNPLQSHCDFVLSNKPSEEELSLVASQMMLSHKHQMLFSLKIGHLFVPPNSGENHLHYCLERLSEC